MSPKDNGPLLSPEEMGFLQGLFGAQDDRADAPPSGRARMELDPLAERDLPAYLKSLGPLEIHSTAPGRRLVFPLAVQEDAGTGHLALELSYPRIFEVHPAKNRSLRVRPDPDDGITVMDPSGLLTAPEVVDVSTSGLLLLDHPSSRVAAGVALPGLMLRIGRDLISVDGTIVRLGQLEPGGDTGPGASEDQRQLMALTLTCEEASQAILEAYVFRRFRESEQEVDNDPFDSAP